MPDYRVARVFRLFCTISALRSFPQGIGVEWEVPGVDGDLLLIFFHDDTPLLLGLLSGRS